MTCIDRKAHGENKIGVIKALREMRVTMNTLKARAKRVGLIASDDRAAGVVRLTCKPGERLEPGLHELVYYYEVNGDFRQEAIQDALEDLVNYAPEPCDAAACEWCEDE